MSELKYLSDGRKVSVVGKINKTEFIVQEVFVTDKGDEIPSGENFTAKSLNDAPVQSWKEKELANVESRYDKAKQEIKVIEKELKLMKGKRQGHVDILSQNKKIISLLNDCNIDDMADILMGNIKYIIESSGYGLHVKEFEDGLFSWDNHYGDRSYEGLKMMSLYALKSSPYMSDRRCGVRISNYTDGSGSERGFTLLKGDKELQEFLFELIESKYKDGKLTLEIVCEAAKYITVPESYIQEIKQSKRKEIQDFYDNSQKTNKQSMDKKLKELE